MSSSTDPVLESISAVLERPGPFATAYVDVSRDRENAPREIALRWQALRRQLAAAGADERTLEAMETAVEESRAKGRAGQVVVAQGGAVVFEDVLPQPPGREEAHWGPLPHLLPYVVQRPAHPTYVLAVADRTGAEVLGFGPSADEIRDADVVVEVEGGELAHLNKVRGGGWSHKRYQNTSEVSWERNTAPVAGTVERLVETLEAELVLLAGDVRAKQLVRDALGGRARELAVEVEAGGLAPGTDVEALQAAVDRKVEALLARKQAAVLDELREELGQDDRAVEGLGPTIDALRQAQVSTLVLVDGAADGTLHIGPEPTHVARSGDVLADLGVSDPVEERADAVLLRAAVGTGAGVVVAGPGTAEVRDGIGAVLRYPRTA